MRRALSMCLVGILAAVGALTAGAGAAPEAEGTTGVKVCGSGYGHGVGLSQYGAYGRAKAGQGYVRIIKSYYRGVSVKKLSSNPNVRVLLGSRSFSDEQVIGVRSSSKARLRNLATDGTVTLGPGKYSVQYLSSKKLYRVTNVSKRKVVGSYRGPVVFERVSGSWLGYGGESYRGSLRAQASGGRLLMVNFVRMESYVRGVVPNEMPASWATEALKSQAVAARSYARATRGGSVFDFYADTRDQVYRGRSSETRATNRAVAATARVHAVYGGKAITAFFHSSAGGYTEDASYVFNSTPYLKAVKDVDSSGRPFERRVSSSWLHWSGTLNANGSPELGVGSITRVRVLKRSPSGRVTRVEVTGTKGKTTISGEYDVRSHLESNGLRRTDGSSYSAGDLPSARVRFGSDCG